MAKWDPDKALKPFEPVMAAGTSFTRVLMDVSLVKKERSLVKRQADLDVEPLEGVRGNQALLIEFVRSLLGEVSDDAVYLAMYAAIAKTGATREEGALLLKVLQRERSENSIWPKGFL
jgi:hypothetical protein